VPGDLRQPLAADHQEPQQSVRPRAQHDEQPLHVIERPRPLPVDARPDQEVDVAGLENLGHRSTLPVGTG